MVRQSAGRLRRLQCGARTDTQDEGIHKKARRLSVDDRVHTLADAVSMLSRLNPQDETFDPVVDTVPLHSLRLDDPIFDSLREEYGGFGAWFEDAARDGRQAFVVRDPDGQLVGICIFKGTDHEIGADRNPAKVSTLEVASEFKGSRYGELLLKVLLRPLRVSTILFGSPFSPDTRA